MGAVMGAGAATLASSDVVRLAFVAYLGVTLLDCLARRGFLSPSGAGSPQLAGRIPDRVHARVYLGLLALVMVSMMFK